MSKIVQVYKVVQALSFDVVTGACFMAYLMGQFLDVTLPPIIFFELASAVWLIYTMDHILDARGIDSPITFRHAFHKNHAIPLLWVWLTVFIASTFLGIVYLPVSTIKFGMVAVALVLIHFVLVRLIGQRISIFIHKELGVGMAYALGIFVGPFSLVPDIGYVFYLLPAEVFLLAMINLLQFSYFEHAIDRMQQQTSMSRNLGRKRTGLLITLFLLAQTALVVLGTLLIADAYTMHTVLGMITLTYWLIWGCRSYFSNHERYRILGDGIFNLPVILMFVA